MRPMPELTVEEAPTDELIPYANNAKIHTNEQVEQICTSIQEFGFNDPVAVWDGPDGPEIIEGHGRVLAAKRLGLEKLPVIRLDHLDDAQRRAYTHVHNQLTMNTGWDFAKLDEELDALAELDIDMDDFGFDSSPTSKPRRRKSQKSYATNIRRTSALSSTSRRTPAGRYPSCTRSMPHG